MATENKDQSAQSSWQDIIIPPIKVPIPLLHGLTGDGGQSGCNCGRATRCYCGTAGYNLYGMGVPATGGWASGYMGAPQIARTEQDGQSAGASNQAPPTTAACKCDCGCEQCTCKQSAGTNESQDTGFSAFMRLLQMSQFLCGQPGRQWYMPMICGSPAAPGGQTTEPAERFATQCHCDVHGCQRSKKDNVQKDTTPQEESESEPPQQGTSTAGQCQCGPALYNRTCVPYMPYVPCMPYNACHCRARWPPSCHCHHEHKQTRSRVDVYTRESFTQVSIRPEQRDAECATSTKFSEKGVMVQHDGKHVSTYSMPPEYVTRGIDSHLNLMRKGYSQTEIIEIMHRGVSPMFHMRDAHTTPPPRRGRHVKQTQSETQQVVSVQVSTGEPSRRGVSTVSIHTIAACDTAHQDDRTNIVKKHAKYYDDTQLNQNVYSSQVAQDIGSEETSPIATMLETTIDQTGGSDAQDSLKSSPLNTTTHTLPSGRILEITLKPPSHVPEEPRESKRKRPQTEATVKKQHRSGRTRNMVSAEIIEITTEEHRTHRAKRRRGSVTLPISVQTIRPDMATSIVQTSETSTIGPESSKVSSKTKGQSLHSEQDSMKNAPPELLDESFGATNTSTHSSPTLFESVTQSEDFTLPSVPVIVEIMGTHIESNRDSLSNLAVLMHHRGSDPCLKQVRKLCHCGKYCGDVCNCMECQTKRIEEKCHCCMEPEEPIWPVSTPYNLTFGAQYVELSRYGKEASITKTMCHCGKMCGSVCDCLLCSNAGCCGNEGIPLHETESHMSDASREALEDVSSPTDTLIASLKQARQSIPFTLEGLQSGEQRHIYTEKAFLFQSNKLATAENIQDQVAVTKKVKSMSDKQPLIPVPPPTPIAQESVQRVSQGVSARCICRNISCSVEPINRNTAIQVITREGEYPSYEDHALYFHYEWPDMDLNMSVEMATMLDHKHVDISAKEYHSKPMWNAGCQVTTEYVTGDQQHKEYRDSGNQINMLCGHKRDVMHAEESSEGTSMTKTTGVMNKNGPMDLWNICCQVGASKINVGTEIDKDMMHPTEETRHTISTQVDFGLQPADYPIPVYDTMRMRGGFGSNESTDNLNDHYTFDESEMTFGNDTLNSEQQPTAGNCSMHKRDKMSLLSNPSQISPECSTTESTLSISSESNNSKQNIIKCLSHCQLENAEQLEPISSDAFNDLVVTTVEATMYSEDSSMTASGGRMDCKHKKSNQCLSNESEVGKIKTISDKQIEKWECNTLYKRFKYADNIQNVLKVDTSQSSQPTATKRRPLQYNLHTHIATDSLTTGHIITPPMPAPRRSIHGKLPFNYLNFKNTMSAHEQQRQGRGGDTNCRISTQQTKLEKSMHTYKQPVPIPRKSIRKNNDNKPSTRNKIADLRWVFERPLTGNQKIDRRNSLSKMHSTLKPRSVTNEQPEFAKCTPVVEGIDSTKALNMQNRNQPNSSYSYTKQESALSQCNTTNVNSHNKSSHRKQKLPSRCLISPSYSKPVIRLSGGGGSNPHDRKHESRLTLFMAPEAWENHSEEFMQEKTPDNLTSIDEKGETASIKVRNFKSSIAKSINDSSRFHSGTMSLTELQPLSFQTEPAGQQQDTYATNQYTTSDGTKTQLTLRSDTQINSVPIAEANITSKSKAKESTGDYNRKAKHQTDTVMESQARMYDWLLTEIHKEVNATKSIGPKSDKQYSTTTQMTQIPSDPHMTSTSPDVEKDVYVMVQHDLKEDFHPFSILWGNIFGKMQHISAQDDFYHLNKCIGMTARAVTDKQTIDVMDVGTQIMSGKDAKRVAKNIEKHRKRSRGPRRITSKSRSNNETPMTEIIKQDYKWASPVEEPRLTKTEYVPLQAQPNMATNSTTDSRTIKKLDKELNRSSESSISSFSSQTIEINNDSYTTNYDGSTPSLVKLRSFEEHSKLVTQRKNSLICDSTLGTAPCKQTNSNNPNKSKRAKTPQSSKSIPSLNVPSTSQSNAEDKTSNGCLNMCLPQTGKDNSKSTESSKSSINSKSMFNPMCVKSSNSIDTSQSESQHKKASMQDTPKQQRNAEDKASNGCLNMCLPQTGNDNSKSTESSKSSITSKSMFNPMCVKSSNSIDTSGIEKEDTAFVPQHKKASMHARKTKLTSPGVSVSSSEKNETCDVPCCTVPTLSNGEVPNGAKSKTNSSSSNCVISRCMMNPICTGTSQTTSADKNEDTPKQQRKPSSIKSAKQTNPKNQSKSVTALKNESKTVPIYDIATVWCSANDERTEAAKTDVDDLTTASSSSRSSKSLFNPICVPSSKSTSRDTHSHVGKQLKPTNNSNEHTDNETKNSQVCSGIRNTTTCLGNEPCAFPSADKSDSAESASSKSLINPICVPVSHSTVRNERSGSQEGSNINSNNSRSKITGMKENMTCLGNETCVSSDADMATSSSTTMSKSMINPICVPNSDTMVESEITGSRGSTSNISTKHTVKQAKDTTVCDSIKGAIACLGEPTCPLADADVASSSASFSSKSMINPVCVPSSNTSSGIGVTSIKTNKAKKDSTSSLKDSSKEQIKTSSMQSSIKKGKRQKFEPSCAPLITSLKSSDSDSKKSKVTDVCCTVSSKQGELANNDKEFILSCATHSDTENHSHQTPDAISEASTGKGESNAQHYITEKIMKPSISAHTITIKGYKPVPALSITHDTDNSNSQLDSQNKLVSMKSAMPEVSGDAQTTANQPHMVYSVHSKKEEVVQVYVMKDVVETAWRRSMTDLPQLTTNNPKLAISDKSIYELVTAATASDVGQDERKSLFESAAIDSNISYDKEYSQQLRSTANEDSNKANESFVTMNLQTADTDNSPSDINTEKTEAENLHLIGGGGYADSNFDISSQSLQRHRIQAIEHKQSVLNKKHGPGSILTHHKLRSLFEGQAELHTSRNNQMANSSTMSPTSVEEIDPFETQDPYEIDTRLEVQASTSSYSGDLYTASEDSNIGDNYNDCGIDTSWHDQDDTKPDFNENNKTVTMLKELNTRIAQQTPDMQHTPAQVMKESSGRWSSVPSCNTKMQCLPAITNPFKTRGNRSISSDAHTRKTKSKSESNSCEAKETSVQKQNRILKMLREQRHTSDLGQEVKSCGHRQP